MENLKKSILFSLISVFLQVYTGSFVLMFLAKLLKLSNFGELSFGIALSGIIATCADFGLSLMTIRDLPQNRFISEEYLSNVFTQKLIISIVVLFLGYLYIQVFFSSENYFWIKLLFLIDGIILSYSGYLVAFFQATNKFKTEAYSVILGAVSLTIIVLSHYILKFSFEILCLFFVFSHLVKLIWLLVSSKQVNSIKKLTYNKKIQNYLFKNSWSFGLHYIIGVFYFSVDTQIIAKILGINQLALYSSAFRVITAILLFSNIISQVFLPYLSSRYKQIDNQFKEIVQQLILVVFCCTYFIGTVMIIFREEVMSLLYKVEYIGSAILFMPLLFMCLLRGMAGIFGILLTISNHQENRVKAIIASLIISFASNYILIPIYKIQGAAFASMLTHMVLLISYIFYVYRIYNTTFMNKKLILIFIFTNAFTLVLYLFIKSKLLSLILLGILLLIVIKFLQREILYFFEIIKGNFNNSNIKIS